MKHWSQSKTIITNLLLALIAATANNSELFHSVLGDKGYQYLLLLSCVANIYLRTTTTTAITKQPQ